MNSGFGGATRETSSSAVQDRNSTSNSIPKPFFSFSIIQFELENPTKRALGRLYSIFTIQSYFIEDLIARYVNSADAGMKSMEEIQRSQTASMHNMESQIDGLPNTTERILEKQAKTVIVLRAKELKITTPIFVDEEEEIDLVSEGPRYCWNP
ncbi:hypothetical protein M9H77_36341 [Catharanthus roseus]|uniref:Uncharacterized protein n=1 Tax=Catharanthus roseus TaxID=4058 RepID=A0ACB9ZU48_CATRO|nr:hypothetical protein M9H77_36341 [Catharanthus roseus]